MFDHSTWRPAYGTLISPVDVVHRRPDDAVPRRPRRQRRARRRVVRPAGRPGPPARRPLADDGAVLAAIAVLAPTVLFTTNWVWSEALVQVTFLRRRARRAAVPRHGSPRWGVVDGARRGARVRDPQPAAAAVRRSPSCSSSWRRVRPPAALVAGRRAARAARRRAVRRRRRARASSSTACGTTRRRRTPPAGCSADSGTSAPSAASLLGQVWYQLVVTVGVAGLGTIALVARRAGRASRPAARRRRPDRARRRRAARRAVDRVHDRPLAARPDRLRPLQRRRDGPGRASPGWPPS